MVEDRGWRYELKMACDLARLAQARTWIRLHPAGFRTAFPPRTVNNLYFDTPDLNSLFANTYGVGSRQKLRLRWYGETLPTTLSHSVLELKYKDNMLGNKKTEGLDCTLDFSQTYRQIRQTIQENSSPYWRQWLSSAAQPALINRYRREYYVSQDGEIRATLDYNLAFFDQLHSLRPNLKTQAIMPSAAIIEVKSTAEQAVRLEAIMADFPLPRVRFSKYVSGVMAGNF
jgi:hypothetical protein